MKLCNKVIFSIQITQAPETTSHCTLFTLFIAYNIRNPECLSKFLSLFIYVIKRGVVFTVLKDSTTVPPCGLLNLVLKSKTAFLIFCFTSNSVF